MKKNLGKKRFIIILLLLLLAGGFACSRTQNTSGDLSQLPKGYSLEDAKKDGYVVFENSDITSGQSTWDDFLMATEKEEAAKVRLAYYYTLGDKSRYAPEYYEEIKDDYPALYIHELRYDGDSYILEVKEEEQVISSEYQYLVKYEGKPHNASATFTDYVYYVLVNDPDVTWDELQWGMLSSDFNDSIEHHTVYSDLKFRESDEYSRKK